MDTELTLMQLLFYRLADSSQQLAAGSLRYYERPDLGANPKWPATRTSLDGSSLQCASFIYLCIVLRTNPFPRCVVKGVEYGRGTSGTKGAAAEEAARQAVVGLENELP